LTVVDLFGYENLVANILPDGCASAINVALHRIGQVGHELLEAFRDSRDDTGDL